MKKRTVLGSVLFGMTMLALTACSAKTDGDNQKTVTAADISADHVQNSDEFALLRDSLGAETPYILQEKLEEQLKLRLDESIYYDGGTAYESPLLSYKGQELEYAVVHNPKWDEANKTAYSTYILLQPASENMATTMVQMSVYNDTMYMLTLQGNLKRKLDLGDLEDVQNALADLMGASEDFEYVKFWYDGTVKIGNGEAPEYGEFEGKEERSIEILDWAKDFLKRAELKEDAEIVIRDFRKEDSSTDVLIGTDKGTYLLLPYYFYQENNFQKPLELRDNENRDFIEKIKKMSIKIG